MAIAGVTGVPAQLITRAPAASRGLDGVAAPQAPEKAGDSSGFGDLLTRALDSVDADMKTSDAQVAKVVRGDPVELHTVMMSLEKADVAVRLMTQVGRRALDAYREIMRMNV